MVWEILFWPEHLSFEGVGLGVYVQLLTWG